MQMGEQRPRDLEGLIRRSAVSEEVIEAYRSGPNWVGFDPVLGYLRRNFVRSPGDASPSFTAAIEPSTLLSTVTRHGARTSFIYADRRPRVNVYGNSFTESMQVNDGETWEEYLAAHLGEPIGNYGIGGHGVYQAYLRMVATESTQQGGDHVLLYIWGDDPIRSLYRSRWTGLCLSIDTTVRNGQTAFFGGPWPHVELDVETGDFIEVESSISSASDLSLLTDPEWLVREQIGDIALELSAFGYGTIQLVDRTRVDRLAAALAYSFDWSQPDAPESALDGSALLHARAGARQDLTLQTQALDLLNRYAQSATTFVLDRALEFTRSHGKRLMALLNMTAGSGLIAAESDLARRVDQPTIDHCLKNDVPVFDMNEVHAREWVQLNERLKEPQTYSTYLKHYLANGSGHYNPQGNHLFAYAAKDAIVDWLDPRPVTYSQPDARDFDFTPYLGSS
jgi:hypothetical protein